MLCLAVINKKIYVYTVPQKILRAGSKLVLPPVCLLLTTSQLIKIPVLASRHKIVLTILAFYSYSLVPKKREGLAKIWGLYIGQKQRLGLRKVS